jgi:hypothetical protein
METLWEPKEYLTHQGTEYDQVLIKRNMTDDGDTPYVRMPHKRGAITPTSQTPYRPKEDHTTTTTSDRNPTSATNQTTPAGPNTPGLDRGTARHITRGRVPVNAGTHGADATNPLATRPATFRPDATALANEKGREIAEQLAKVKMDARKEATVLPKAVMYYAAGHLVGDTALIDKGKNLAREVENVAMRIATGQPMFMAERATAVNPANYLSESHN